MAAAGFYMTGKEDETRSPFNMKIIAGWEEGDSPKDEVLKIYKHIVLDFSHFNRFLMKFLGSKTKKRKFFLES